ncbi:MAG: ABC transporter ATP-binding protein [Armatimonadota bacterium]|jgi:ABC-type lipoprotein export system ATPase subunit
MIELENVSKLYQGADGEVRALDDVTLSVATGEFTAVRGPSGCGKSTLLLTVGAMVRPTEGRVLLDGRDVYALSPSHRARLRADRIGFVFQMFHLVPYLNALENVLLPTLAGASPGRDQALELLDRLQLSHRLHHRPAELSTGERQRCALARALLNRPEIILADEPTGNLDPDNAAQVMQYLSEFHRHGGTVLLVSHDPIANEYAQRVLHIERGRVQTQ